MSIHSAFPSGDKQGLSLNGSSRSFTQDFNTYRSSIWSTVAKVYSSISWQDPRASSEVNELMNLINADDVFSITGQPSLNICGIFRLMWLKNNKPGIYKKIYKWLC